MIAPLVHLKKLAAYRLELFEIQMAAIPALIKRLGLFARKPKRKTSKFKTPCASARGVLLLMGTKDAPGNRPSLEQAEAEQHGIAHAPPYRADVVVACGDTLYQYRIDGNADENE